MEKTILITNENHKNVLESLKYGYINVRYIDENVRKKFNDKIKLVNEYFKSFAVEEKQALEFKSNGVDWVSSSIDDTYQILFKKLNTEFPVLSDDCYRLEDLASEACSGKKKVLIYNLDVKLFSYARKLAAKYSVRLLNDGYFDGSEKSLSVTKQLGQCFLNGNEYICFESSKYNPQTIRSTASAFGNTIGIPLRVSIKFGIITVYFKEKTEVERIKDEIIYQISMVKKKTTPEDFYSFIKDISENNKIIIPEVSIIEEEEDDF